MDVPWACSLTQTEASVVWDVVPLLPGEEVRVVANLEAVHKCGQLPWTPAAEPAVDLGRVWGLRGLWCSVLEPRSLVSYVSAQWHTARRVFISLVLV